MSHFSHLHDVWDDSNQPAYSKPRSEIAPYITKSTALPQKEKILQQPIQSYSAAYDSSRETSSQQIGLIYSLVHDIREMSEETQRLNEERMRLAFKLKKKKYIEKKKNYNQERWLGASLIPLIILFVIFALVLARSLGRIEGGMMDMRMMQYPAMYHPQPYVYSPPYGYQ